MSSKFRWLLAPTISLLMLPGMSHAQRLYDEARDKEAQKAVLLADDITSKSTFEKQLKNLDTTARHDLEVYFAGAKRQMELDVRTFRTWSAVVEVVTRVESTLNTADFIPDADAQAIADDFEKDCAARTTELGLAICAAKAKLKSLKDAVDASERENKALEEELKTRLEKIGTIESLIDKTESFLKSDSKTNTTIKGLSDVFINLSKSYVNYVNKLAVINNEPRGDLRLLLQRIAVEALQLEVDHWKTVGEIKLRRAQEQQEIKNLVNDVNFRLSQIAQCMAVDMTTLKAEKVNVTFGKAQALATCTINSDDTPKEEILAYLLQTLHGAAALAARGETPMKLAELRLAQEEHRFSIRHSAVIARSYEVALTNGTKRLARFYAGGLKPEKIAQLIYSAATLAIPGVIAAK